MMFLNITVKDIINQSVLNIIRVGKDFLILAHINNEDVSRVIKCNHHTSTPKTKLGIMMAALAIQAESSIIL